MLRTMKIYLLMIVVILLALTSMPLRAEDVNPLAIVRNNKPAIVKFISKDKKPKVLGYGFVINPEGLVLTNSHVIGSEIFVVEDSKHKNYDVNMLVFRDSKRDLVLIKLADVKDMPVVELGDSKSLDIGDKVITIADVKNEEYVVNNSIVERLINYPARDQNRIMLENTAPVSETVEGTPLFDQKGQVVGILTSSSDENDPIGLFGIAINDLHKYKNHIKATLKDSSSTINVSKANYKKQEVEEPVEKENKFVPEESKTVTIKKEAPGKYVMSIKKKNASEITKPVEKTYQTSQKQAIEKKSTTTSAQKSTSKTEIKSKDKQISVVNKKPKKRWTLFSFRKKKNNPKPAEKETETVKVSASSHNTHTSRKPEPQVEPVQKEEDDHQIASAITEPELRSGQTFKTPNDFQVDLSGCWFDIDSGLNLMIEKKGNTLTLKSMASEIPSSSSESIIGTFKKEGNVYAGVMDNTIICKKSNNAKSLTPGSSCVLKEPAEIYFWDASKISLKINTVNNYDCRVCSDRALRTWKDRTWLKKAVSD